MHLGLETVQFPSPGGTLARGAQCEVKPTPVAAMACAATMRGTRAQAAKCCWTVEDLAMVAGDVIAELEKLVHQQKQSGHHLSTLKRDWRALENLATSTAELNMLARQQITYEEAKAIISKIFANEINRETAQEHKTRADLIGNAADRAAPVYRHAKAEGRERPVSQPILDTKEFLAGVPTNAMEHAEIVKQHIQIEKDHQVWDDRNDHFEWSDSHKLARLLLPVHPTAVQSVHNLRPSFSIEPITIFGGPDSREQQPLTPPMLGRRYFCVPTEAESEKFPMPKALDFSLCDENSEIEMTPKDLKDMYQFDAPISAPVPVRIASATSLAKASCKPLKTLPRDSRADETKTLSGELETMRSAVAVAEATTAVVGDQINACERDLLVRWNSKAQWQRRHTAKEDLQAQIRIAVEAAFNRYADEVKAATCSVNGGGDTRSR